MWLDVFWSVAHVSQSPSAVFSQESFDEGDRCVAQDVWVSDVASDNILVDFEDLAAFKRNGADLKHKIIISAKFDQSSFT